MVNIQFKSAVLAILLSCMLCGCAEMTPMQRTAMVASGVILGGVAVAASLRPSPYLPGATAFSNSLFFGPGFGMGALIAANSVTEIWGANHGTDERRAARLSSLRDWASPRVVQNKDKREARSDRSPDTIPYSVDRDKTVKLVSSYHAYLAEFPGDRQAWLEAGDLYLQLGRQADAETCFKWARSRGNAGEKEVVQASEKLKR